jgi:hypothetical protein
MRDCLMVLEGFNGPGRIAGAHGEKPGSDFQTLRVFLANESCKLCCRLSACLISDISSRFSSNFEADEGLLIQSTTDGG